MAPSLRAHVSVLKYFIFFLFLYLWPYLISRRLACLFGNLASSADNQKLFCRSCSIFWWIFEVFVGRQVISPSYSSTIFFSPPTVFSFFCVCTFIFKNVKSPTAGAIFHQRECFLQIFLFKNKIEIMTIYILSLFFKSIMHLERAYPLNCLSAETKSIEDLALFYTFWKGPVILTHLILQNQWPSTHIYKFSLNFSCTPAQCVKCDRTDVVTEWSKRCFICITIHYNMS